MVKSMKTAFIGLVVPVAGLAATSAMAGEFTIVNTNSSVSIQEIWTAGAGMTNDPWNTANFSSPVGPGTSRSFTTDGNVCFYDVRVEYSDGYRQVFTNVNVCRGDRVIGT